MANKQTKRLRKLGISTYNNGPTCGETTFEVYKGRECITDFKLREKNPQNKRGSAWLGARRRPMAERGERE